MKSIIAIAALAAAFAVQADTIATTKNKLGGTINLTDNTSPRCTRLGDYLAVYSIDPTNNGIIRGCWRVIDDNAHVMWDSGEEKMFPLEYFTRTPYGEQLRMRKQGGSL